MVAGTLFTYPDSHKGFKSRIAAAYSGFKLTVTEVKENDKTHSHVPSFSTEDKKLNIFDANAVAYYVANDQLRGVSLEDRAHVIQWMNYGDTTVASAVASWVYPALGLVESTNQHVHKAKEDLKKVFTFLNDQLKTRTYLVGERITLADISLAIDLLLAYQHVADDKFRQPFTNLNRWFTTITNQPNFKAVVGEVKICGHPIEYDPKKHVEHKKEAAHHEEKKKEQKPKAEKPAPAPKKEEPKPAADDAEDDETASEEPKNDPFAAFPKGNFNMDEFKRTYSNQDTATVALPYFWKNFEKDHYSLWFCEYKYASELTLTFMSSNLIGGMYQRLERLRKNAFASMAVFGEDNNNTIAGVWFWRGQDLAFPLCSDWTTDYESYSWRKMNPDDENDKKLVNQFFLWEGALNGKKFVNGKIFK